MAEWMKIFQKSLHMSEMEKVQNSLKSHYGQNIFTFSYNT
jgi:hypothetical protein